MQSGLLQFARRKPEPVSDDAIWSPLTDGGVSQPVSARAAAGTSFKAKNPLRLIMIVAIIVFGAVMMLPTIIAALLMPFHGGIVIHLAFMGLTMLGFFAVASGGLSRLAKARNAIVHLPAIRDPVRDAAVRQDLVHHGILTSERSDILRASVGDVHTALGFGGQADGGTPNDLPDEFHGAFPDGSPFWCLIKKTTIPLAGVPEHHRRAGQPDPDVKAHMLTMLVAFPQHRRSGLRLEILHRFMQVRFARIATTLDTGSSAFNMRFFVAARGVEDLVPVFRIVTPALQTLLIGLFERFWLVNLVVNDTAAFLGAVAFSPKDAAPEDGDAWVSAALHDVIAGAARAKTYLD